MYIEDLLAQVISARSIFTFIFYAIAAILFYLAVEKKSLNSKQDSMIALAAALVFFTGLFSIDTSVGILTSTLVAMTIGLMWLAIQPLRRAAKKSNVIISVSYEGKEIHIANRGTNAATDLKIVSNVIGLSDPYDSKIEPESILILKCRRIPDRIEIRWTPDTEQVLSYGVWTKPKKLFRRQGYYVLESSN